MRRTKRELLSKGNQYIPHVPLFLRCCCCYNHTHHTHTAAAVDELTRCCLYLQQLGVLAKSIRNIFEKCPGSSRWKINRSNEVPRTGPCSSSQKMFVAAAV